SAPGPQQELQFNSFQNISCAREHDRIFRVSVFRDTVFLGSFDLEEGVRGAGDRSLIVRSEDMQELLAWKFKQPMNPSGELEAVFGQHRVTGFDEGLSIDGYSIGVGPGEIACLAGGLFPSTWLDFSQVLWDPSIRRFVLSTKNRTVRFNTLPGGVVDVEVSWSSSWFSTESIHVIITGNSSGGALQGRLMGPHGILIKWVEV
ncbi:MAG: hypothetical protein EBU49_11715, partial [Proteobacteria bacterium]|nr:hypothetical protein [Pseudomonadota bacterium]